MVSFISIITVVLGFLLTYYEKNIMLLKISSYDSYAIEEDGTQTDFKETSWKTIFASLFYHPWILRCCPTFIQLYYKNHFKALEIKSKEIDMTNFFTDLKKLSVDNG